MDFPKFLTEDEKVNWAREYARSFAISALIVKHLKEFEETLQEETRKILQVMHVGEHISMSSGKDA